jgi:hypothetical protein
MQMIATGKASWAKVLPHQLVTQDEYRDYSYWSIDLEVSDAEKKRLKGLNLRPYHKDDGETETNIYKFMRRESNKSGKVNTSPTIVDADKNPWGSEEIGNGSTINVSFYTYEHPKTKKFGLGKGLNAIQVVELVPYAGAGGVSDFEAVGTATEEF